MSAVAFLFRATSRAGSMSSNALDQIAGPRADVHLQFFGLMFESARDVMKKTYLPMSR